MKMKKTRRDKPWVSTTIIAALIAGAAYGMYTGVDILGKNLADDVISQFDEKDVEHTEQKEPVLLREDTPAYAYIKNVATKNYDGDDRKFTKSKGVPTFFGSWVCGFDTSDLAPLSASQVGLKDKTSILITAFGAGQAAKTINTYRDKITTCKNRDGSALFYNRYSPLGLSDAQGFSFYLSTGKSKSYVNVWYRGDSILSVSGPNVQRVSEVSQWYDEKVINALTETSCVSLESAIDDSKRSPFYDTASYEGWNKGRTVKVKGKAFGISVGVLSSDESFNGEGNRVGKKPKGSTQTHQLLNYPSSVTKPELPVPDAFPMELPEEKKKPEIRDITLPVQPPSSTKIKERVKDVYGPGCGWVWSGQKMPMYDDAAEKKRADKAASKAAESLRIDLSNYLSKSDGLLNDILEYNRQAYLWNKYVEETLKIVNQWDELNTQRDNFRRLLDAYYESVEAHEEFLEDQSKAQEAYDEAMEGCVPEVEEPELPIEPTDEPTTEEPTTEVTETPSAEPTNDPTTQPAPTCPEKPAILDQEAPKVLPVPEKPNFPLPESWKDLPWEDNAKQ